MTASKDKIALWWPNGMGAQPLYNISVGIIRSSQRQPRREPSRLTDNVTTVRILHESFSLQWIRKRIGFRTSALVTINETAFSMEYVYNTSADNLRQKQQQQRQRQNTRRNQQEEGTGLHGMYFRINGALVMSRGANIIPADQLEGRYSRSNSKPLHNNLQNKNDQAFRTIVQSAAAANMNMIRVWGGGKVLPQAFYDACDEYGVMVYQDQMFVDEDGHGPSRTVTIQQEIQHMVRSLASHPSIVVWNGCNECQVVMGEASEIYASFVLQIVSQEDDTRSIWPSSPSHYGWETGVNRLDCKPNGNPLATRDPSKHEREPVLESHGPYMRSFSKSYPGVNGVDQHFPYPKKPRKLYNVSIGPQYPNVFASEFGSSVWSSFESLSGTLSPKYWSLHGGSAPDTCSHLVGNVNICQGSNVMAQRNYPCDTHIQFYFGDSTSLDNVGEGIFQAQLYQCMMAQALWMKGEIEVRRSSNSFGLLIWQLNENWPTGGWGLIEYSSSTLPGQMLGGRWKPLMHMLQNSLFRDVFAACGDGNECFVRNDGTRDVEAIVTLEAWNIAKFRNESSSKSLPTFTFRARLSGGVASTARFQAPPDWLDHKYDAMIIRVTDGRTGAVLSRESVFLWVVPKSIENLRTTKVVISIESIQQHHHDQSSAAVTLSSNGLALYVVLTCRASGRFDDNAFVLKPFEKKTVVFRSLAAGDVVEVDTLSKTLRVEHLGYYFYAPQ